MVCLLTLVWVWPSLERENIMRVLRARYHQTKNSPNIGNLRKPLDPIEGLHDGHIPDLIKVKLKTGPVTYDIFTHNLIINVVPGTYVIFPQNMLLNMWFLK